MNHLNGTNNRINIARGGSKIAKSASIRITNSPHPSSKQASAMMQTTSAPHKNSPIKQNSRQFATNLTNIDQKHEEEANSANNPSLQASIAEKKTRLMEENSKEYNKYFLTSLYLQLNREYIQGHNDYWREEGEEAGEMDKVFREKLLEQHAELLADKINIIRK